MSPEGEDTSVEPGKVESDEEFANSIAPEVLRCLAASNFFEALDDKLSPADGSAANRKCDGTFAITKLILHSQNYEEEELDDIILVLQSRGGFCDCEVLYNVSEENRLKSDYWSRKAAGKNPKYPQH